MRWIVNELVYRISLCPLVPVDAIEVLCPPAEVAVLQLPVVFSPVKVETQPGLDLLWRAYFISSVLQSISIACRNRCCNRYLPCPPQQPSIPQFRLRRPCGLVLHPISSLLHTLSLSPVDHSALLDCPILWTSRPSDRTRRDQIDRRYRSHFLVDYRPCSREEATS